MTAPTKTRPGKAFLGAFIDATVVAGVVRVAEAEFRKNKSWAFESLLSEALARRSKKTKKKFSLR